MRFPVKALFLCSASAVVLAVVVVFAGAWNMSAEIKGFRARVRESADMHPSPRPVAADLSHLPEPVRRYFAFTFPGPVPEFTYVEMEMAGDFRRPNSERFEYTTASQTMAAGTAALVFDADTPILPGIWARVYDAFVDGQMTMIARLLDVFTVVEESSSPELDRISLRRWLLETPLCPVALLPGGLVRWEAVDARRARAVAAYLGMEASLVATFRDDGSLARFDTETDGDLTTPYHGSGERVIREDYKLVDGMMLPMRFTISRVAKGRAYPFWKGGITRIRFQGTPSRTQ